MFNQAHSHVLSLLSRGPSLLLLLIMPHPVELHVAQHVTAQHGLQRIAVHYTSNCVFLHLHSWVQNVANRKWKKPISILLLVPHVHGVVNH